MVPAGAAQESEPEGKRKRLTDRISDGGTAMVLGPAGAFGMSGEEMPPVKDYLKAKQKSGEEFLCGRGV